MSSSSASSPSSAHKPTGHGQGTEAKPWPNDLGDPTSFPLFEFLTKSPGAVRAFTSLCRRQRDNDGRTCPQGNPLPTLVEPMTVEMMTEHKGAPEAAFGRPKGCLNISRSFFPDIKKRNLLKQFASKQVDLTNKNSPAEILKLTDDMVAYMEIFTAYMADCCVSKLQCFVINYLSNHPIKLSDGSSIDDMETLKKRWKAEFPDKIMAEAMFHLLFKNMDTRQFDFLCFQICMEQRIWFPCSSTEHDMTKRGDKASGPKVTMLVTLMKARFRDNFRKTFTRAPHGMTLNVNVKARRGKALEFDYGKHLVGNETLKHKQWLGTQSAEQVWSAVYIFQFCFLNLTNMDVFIFRLLSYRPSATGGTFGALPVPRWHVIVLLCWKCPKLVNSNSPLTRERTFLITKVNCLMGYKIRKT